MDAPALADRVVHASERSESLAEFIVAVLPVIRSLDECRAALDELEGAASPARAEAARRLRLAEMGGLWPRAGRPVDAPVVQGRGQLVGFARSGPSAR